MGLVDADRTALPIACGFDPGFVEATLIDQVAAQQLGGLRFACSPGVAVAGAGQGQSADRIEQGRGIVGAG